MAPLGKTQTTAQHSKDFRKLQSELVKVCTSQCLRQERAYQTDNEYCMAKCFDLAYIYTKVGCAEINLFSYENQLQRSGSK